MSTPDPATPRPDAAGPGPVRAGKDWVAAYAEDVTPWDLRGPTPPLERLLGSGVLADHELPEAARVAVPGCGRGHDLQVWARAGHRVTGFDIVPAAVAEARQLAAINGVDVEVLQRDVLGLDREFQDRFDVVYDYTCLCALPPHLRRAYARNVHSILRPGGLYLLLAFPMDPAHPVLQGDGPPFLLEETELRVLWGHRLEPRAELPAEASAPSRLGAERWFLYQRRHS